MQKSSNNLDKLTTIEGVLKEYGKPVFVSPSPGSQDNFDLYRVYTKHWDSINDAIDFYVIVRKDFVLLTDGGWTTDTLFSTDTLSGATLKKFQRVCDKNHTGYCSDDMHERYMVYRGDIFHVIKSSSVAPSVLRKDVKTYINALVAINREFE